MGRQVWFKQHINGRDYMVHKDTGARRIISKCGTYLYYTPHERSVVKEILKHKYIPTMNDLFGFENKKKFLDYVGEIFVNDLGFTWKEFKDNSGDDPPILNPLYQVWRDTRDASWLYRHRLYAFETLHCAMKVTAKPGSKGDISDKFSALYNTIVQLEMLGYDNKKEFKALDLCSGMGLTTLFLAKRFPNGTFYYNELNQQSRFVFTKLLQKSGLTNIKVLQSEEVDEELDIVLGFEAVEHIPHPKLKGVGQPFPWTQKFLNKIKKGGHFIYETMWNAEFNQNGNVLGHFLEYEFSGTVWGVCQNRNGGLPEWAKFFHKELENHNFRRMQGMTGCGLNGLKWSLRCSPKIFLKEV